MTDVGNGMMDLDRDFDEGVDPGSGISGSSSGEMEKSTSCINLKPITSGGLYDKVIGLPEQAEHREAGELHENRSHFQHSSLGSPSSEELDKTSPMRVHHKDLVCFMDDSNQLRIGRVKETSYEYNRRKSHTVLGLLGSIIKKPGEPRPQVLVSVGNKLGPFEQPLNSNTQHGDVRNGGSGLEFVVDEDKIGVMHYTNVEGLQVLKDGRKGRIQQSGPSTQMAHVKVHGYDTIIPFVKVADFQTYPVWKIRSGQTVLYEDWIGRVKLINRIIQMKMPDGSHTTWEWEECDSRFSKNEDMHWNADLPFVNGQSIRMPLHTISGDTDRMRHLIIEGSSFLPNCATVPQACILQPPEAYVIAKVASMKVMLVKIEWLKRIPGSQRTEPIQETFANLDADTVWEKLSVLDQLSGDFVKVGSQRYYKVKPTDKLLSPADAQHHLLQTWFPEKFRKKNFKSVGTELNGIELLVEVLMVYSGIEVYWEDGMINLVSAPKLRGCIFSCPLKLAEFSVGCIVVTEVNLIKNVYAVVQQVFPDEFKLTVRWFRQCEEDGKCEALNTEIVSCFDVKRLDYLSSQSDFLISWRPNGDQVGSVVCGKKTCIVRRDENVKSFKAAVLLRSHHANHEGMLTAFCGNEVLSLSPFDILNCEAIFEGKKDVRQKLIKVIDRNPELNFEAQRKESESFILDRSLEPEYSKEIKNNFSILKKAPTQHYFESIAYDSKDIKFTQRLEGFQTDFKLNFSDIWVATYEDRLDLFSFLIAGRYGTPYYGGIFAFEMYMSKEYPEKVPLIVYVGPSSLPNTLLGRFDNSKRITSLLGVSDFQNTGWATNFLWDPKTSKLRDILNLIKDLIHTQQTRIVSLSPLQITLHNGLVIAEILKVAYQVLQNPNILAPWGQLIEQGYSCTVMTLVQMIQGWTSDEPEVKPNFSLLPLPETIKMSFRSRLNILLPLLNEICHKKL